MSDPDNSILEPMPPMATFQGHGLGHVGEMVPCDIEHYPPLIEPVDDVSSGDSFKVTVFRKKGKWMYKVFGGLVVTVPPDMAEGGQVVEIEADELEETEIGAGAANLLVFCHVSTNHEDIPHTATISVGAEQPVDSVHANYAEETDGSYYYSIGEIESYTPEGTNRVLWRSVQSHVGSIFHMATISIDNVGEGFNILATDVGLLPLVPYQVKSLKNLGTDSVEANASSAMLIKGDSDTEIEFRGIKGSGSEEQISISTDDDGENIIIKGNGYNRDVSPSVVASVVVKDGLVTNVTTTTLPVTPTGSAQGDLMQWDTVAAGWVNVGINPLQQGAIIYWDAAGAPQRWKVLAPTTGSGTYLLSLDAATGALAWLATSEC